MLGPTTAGAASQQAQAAKGKPAAEVTSGGAGSPFVPVLANLGSGGSAASPPGTPAGGGAGASGSAAAAGGSASGRGSLSPPGSGRTVRFEDQQDHITHDSRTSSADSLHERYEQAAARGEPPPGASGLHVKHTAGGRLLAVSSGARWEELVGYSRAVKRGPFIFVSGTSAVDQASGRVLFRKDAYKQTRLAFTIVERALGQVGASLEDVVRTRMYVRNLPRDGELVSRAHGEVLGQVKPASTMVEVSRLVHEDILVLVEVDAVLMDN